MLGCTTPASDSYCGNFANVEAGIARSRCCTKMAAGDWQLVAGGVAPGSKSCFVLAPPVERCGVTQHP